MEENSGVISPTPYDDSFRTLVIKGGNLIIPFINELFKDNKPISMDATVFNSANEQFLNLLNGAQEKGEADSIIYINGEPYHIECQSTDDGTILVRIAKYDWLEAMRTSKIEGNRINIHIPYSGLLYLRKTVQTPKEMYVHYFDNYGHDFEYPVKVINLADYTLDDLIEKNLIFLLPFYLFNLEKELKDYTKESSRNKIKESYEDIFACLNGLLEQKKITLYQYSLITDVLKKVTDNLAQKNEEARKELDELMGGRILKFKNEEYFDEGRAQGEVSGGIKDLLGLVYDGLLDEKVASDRAFKKYGVNQEDFHRMLIEYKPEEVLMQG